MKGRKTLGISLAVLLAFLLILALIKTIPSPTVIAVSAKAGTSANLITTGLILYLFLLILVFASCFLLWYFNKSFHALEKNSKVITQSPYAEVSVVKVFNILLAAIVIGAIAHELVHFALMSNPTSISIHFGEAEKLISICCLQEGEYAFEEIAYTIQFVATLLWIAVSIPLISKNKEKS